MAGRYNTVKIVLFFLIISPFTVHFGQNGSERELNNLKAFARLYGYVRFFHPSDEAANLDWDKFAVAGVEVVIKCHTGEELKDTLKSLFLPVAPTMNIFSRENEINPKEVHYRRDTTGLDVIAWQHYGVWLSPSSNTYRSYRVFRKGKVAAGNENADIKEINRKPRHTKLFKKFPASGDDALISLGEKIYCTMPLTLYCDSAGTLGKNLNYPLAPLKERISKIELDRLTGNDLSIRLADIIIAWNIYQHFYPYFDIVNVDWNKVLKQSLAEAIADSTGTEFLLTLRRMASKLKDGHAYVSSRGIKEYKLPFRMDIVDEKIIVTTSVADEIKPGWQLISIDGKPADAELKITEELIPGSPHSIAPLALLDLGSSFENNKVKLLFNDGDSDREITVGRISSQWIQEYDHSPIEKLGNGIYYINVNYADKEEFNSVLPELKKAKGIIFDLRFSAKPRNGKTRINIWSDILWKLTDFDLQSARWNYPEIVYPDRRGLSFAETRWTAASQGGGLAGYKVFITDSFDISHMETFMGIVENYKLGNIVGSATAGTNGNSNTFPLPGGYTASFTGMKVLKHDLSQHHLIGIKPDYPVIRTIKGIKERRDEYLEKALQVLNSKIK